MTELQKPLYTLTVGEYISLNQRILREILRELPDTPAPNLPVPDLLTIKEASELLHLSVPTCYTKCHHREIPHNKKGGRLYFSRQELLEWLQKGKRKTNAELEQEANNHVAFKK